jgi:hypothetical protein
VCPAGLGAADPECFILPVEIVQLQARNLAGSQPIRDEQEQDRPVSLVGGPAALGGGQQAQDILPLQPLRHSLVPREPRPNDPRTQARQAPAACLGKTKERTKTLTVIVSIPP